MIRIALLALCMISTSAGAAARSHHAKAQFQRSHPCPSTGKASGTCPGYIIDHVIALACGGPDAPGNMQWQTIADAKAKDRWERIGCKSKDIGRPYK